MFLEVARHKFMSHANHFERKKINRSIQFRMSKSITHDLAETTPTKHCNKKKNKNRQNRNPLWHKCMYVECIWYGQKCQDYLPNFGWSREEKRRKKHEPLETCNGFYSKKIALIIFQTRLKINHVSNCLSNFSWNEWKLVCKCVHYYAVSRWIIENVNRVSQTNKQTNK